MDENTPLLQHRKIGSPNGHSHLGDHGDEEEGWSPRTFFADALRSVQSHVDKPRINLDPAELHAQMTKGVSRAPEVVRTAVKALPAVLLGCLLNILDGVSCEFLLHVISRIRCFFHCPVILGHGL